MHEAGRWEKVREGVGRREKAGDRTFEKRGSMYEAAPAAEPATELSADVGEPPAAPMSAS